MKPKLDQSSLDLNWSAFKCCALDAIGKVVVGMSGMYIRGL